MKFFVLTQQKAPGGPVGMLDGALYDRFYDSSKLKSVDHGAFNWYAGSGYKDGVQTFAPFPDGLVFITKDRGYDFDIRAVGSNFYIVSARFVEAADVANVRFESRKPIDVRDRKGNEATATKYYAARFVYRDRTEVIDEPQSSLFGEDGILKIRRLTIRQDVSESAFRIKDLYPSYDGVFCSDAFRQSADRIGGLRGTGFEDLETAAWPGFRIV